VKVEVLRNKKLIKNIYGKQKLQTGFFR